MALDRAPSDNRVEILQITVSHKRLHARQKKELARNRVRASSEASIVSDRLSIGSSDDDSDGGGSSGVARCSRCARCNNRSTDKVGSTGTGNSRTHSSDNRLQFPLTPARQNAVQV